MEGIEPPWWGGGLLDASGAEECRESLDIVTLGYARSLGIL